MRLPIVLLSTAALGLGLAACGGAGRATSTAHPSSTPTPTNGNSVEPASVGSAPPGHYVKNDDDTDADDRPGGDSPSASDSTIMLDEYGHPASAAEKRAIAALLKSYYTAMAAGDGASACALLSNSIATALSEEHHPSTHTGDRGGCSATVSSIFAHEHKYLAEKGPATAIVTTVHVKGDIGLAVVGFRSSPEGAMPLAREGHAWKVGALFDSEMP
jgi:hypothetical protein